MKPLHLIALAILAVSASNSEAGPGGSGGNGVRGGSGVYCDGKSPRVLESFLAERRNPHFSRSLAALEYECRSTAAPETCFTDRLLAPVETQHPLLASLIRQRLREHGPAAGWKRTFSFLGLPQPDLLTLDDPLAVTIRNHFRKIHGNPANHPGIDPNGRSTYDDGPDAVFDDAPDFDLPPNCVTAQLALVRSGARLPELTLEGEFVAAVPVESRALELHEAIYAVAADLGMDHPVLSRGLGVALLTGKDLPNAVRDFVEYPRRLERFRNRGGSYARIANRPIVLTTSPRKAANCPDAIVLRFDGVRSILAHELRFDETRLSMRFARIREIKDLDPTCEFREVTSLE